MDSANMVLEKRDRRRSTFVSNLAWSFIALAGLAMLVSLFQNIMAGLVFPFNDMHTAVPRAGAATTAPWLANFMSGYVRLLFAMYLLGSAATLVAAIGLLKRKNWARVFFIAIMGLGIVWNLGRIAPPLLIFFFLAFGVNVAAAEQRSQFDIVQQIMIGFSVLIAIAMSVLFAWIISRLLSADIRREFPGAD